jgi:tetratricopeptide (TPR) repeat protein
VGRRLTRKQIKHDEFVSQFDRVLHWFGLNWRQAAIGIGGAFAVVLLVWGVRSLLAGRTGAADRALALAVETYNAPVGDAAPADAKVKFATDAARLDAAEQAFKRLASKYRLTSQSRYARLYLAKITAERGDRDGAIRALSEVARKGSRDPIVRLATLDLFRLRLAKGEGKELVGELEAMVSGKDPRLPRDLALYQLAQIWEREGKPEEATKLYKKLVDDFPDSPYRFDAQQRIAATS